MPALLAALGAEVVRGRAAEGALADLAQLAHVVEGSHQLGHVPTPPSVVLTASMSPRRSWSKPPSGCRVVPAGARGAGRSRAARAVQPPRAGRGPARSDPLAAMSVVTATPRESTSFSQALGAALGDANRPRPCAPAPPRGGPAARSLQGVHRAGAAPARSAEALPPSAVIATAAGHDRGAAAAGARSSRVRRARASAITDVDLLGSSCRHVRDERVVPVLRRYFRRVTTCSAGPTHQCLPRSTCWPRPGAAALRRDPEPPPPLCTSRFGAVLGDHRPRPRGTRTERWYRRAGGAPTLARGRWRSWGGCRRSPTATR